MQGTEALRSNEFYISPGCWRQAMSTDSKILGKNEINWNDIWGNLRIDQSPEYWPGIKSILKGWLAGSITTAIEKKESGDHDE